MALLRQLVGKDIMGREVRVGDYIAYATKRDSVGTMNIYKVLDIDIGRNERSGRDVQIKIIFGLYGLEKDGPTTRIGHIDTRSLLIPEQGPWTLPEDRCADWDQLFGNKD